MVQAAPLRRSPAAYPRHGAGQPFPIRSRVTIWALALLSGGLTVALMAMAGMAGVERQAQRVMRSCEAVAIVHPDGQATGLRAGAVSVAPAGAMTIYACKRGEPR